MVPSAARMYIQPVDSPYLASCNGLSIALPDWMQPVSIPNEVKRYDSGLASPLFDVQLSELPVDMFRVLSSPKVVLR